jgi:RNA repair pathway DNA polymerase beta family
MNQHKDYQEIVKMNFGSHVYGTSLPTSDRDSKGVHLPTAHQIILQDVKDSISIDTKKSATDKNGPDDIDHQSFSLQKFLNLAAQGQTVAMEMLFIPELNWIHSSPEWKIIIRLRSHLLTKQCKGFVGYCHKQASKYGVKGTRLRAVKMLIAILESCDGHVPIPVSIYLIKISDLMSAFEHFSISIYKDGSGEIECCGRKCPIGASVKTALGIYSKVLEQYGHRSKEAETNEGVDWKATMHAVRIAHEAIELLSTGHITFPRPERELLLKIRKGELPYQDVQDLIEQGIVDVESASRNSSLPEKIDKDLIDDVVFNFYQGIVLQEVQDAVDEDNWYKMINNNEMVRERGY